MSEGSTGWFGKVGEWLDWHNPQKYADASKQDALLHQTLEMGKQLMGRDVLTGLPGRGLFIEEIRIKIGMVIRDNYGKDDDVRVVGYRGVLDVNGLKKINDEQGHGAGDKLIQQAADALTKNIRQNDLAARVGGDELAFFLVPSSDEGSDVIRDKMKQLLRDAPVSIGIAPVTLGQVRDMQSLPDNDLFDAFQGEPDGVMYQAKERSRETGKSTMFFQAHVDTPVVEIGC